MTVQTWRKPALLAALCLAPASAAPAQAPTSAPTRAAAGDWAAIIPPDRPRAPLSLSAERLRTYETPEARQGVAVSADHLYAVTNTVIARYRRDNGQRLNHWAGPRGGAVRHLNDCVALEARLYCANSNFPEVPMASSVEVFDAESLEPVESWSLGLRDEGSLTFVEPLGEGLPQGPGWIAGFAHYDGRGGEAHKGAAFAGVVTFDARFRRTGGWAIPEAVRQRMAPQAASGGSVGEDGLLYLFGHSRPELYVFARPRQGPELVHLATIAIDSAGQAFSFDRDAPRILYTIDRPSGTIRRHRLPEVPLDEAQGLRFPAPPRLPPSAE